MPLALTVTAFTPGMILDSLLIHHVSVGKGCGQSSETRGGGPEIAAVHFTANALGSPISISPSADHKYALRPVLSRNRPSLSNASPIICQNYRLWMRTSSDCSTA
ncbi:hypothetical protein BaRGS_00012002 [Batillaria attramentaria]|uniref:Uncharacterized protein n=1 Tax=Batillaria attramentaria TaxID=370345 RepID=A0ABD0LBM9_9CAEN